MSMKKVIIWILTTVFALGIGGCGNPRNRGMSAWFNSEEKMADARLEAIVQALESKDKEALKEMFSEKASEESEKLGTEIDGIMDFYKGDMKEYKGNNSSSSEFHYGKGKTEIDGHYRVETTEAVYHIRFIDQVIQDEKSEEVGLYMIEIIPEVLYEEDGFMWSPIHAGIISRYE